jgi:signal transduction histidine kinase/DNA-binding response OmpR family regulator
MAGRPGSNWADGLVVLIAEDSPTQAEHLCELLESNGFAVIAARDGKEALELARQRRPSVVISDVMMPEMDGYELCRALKGDAELKNIPAILVTELSSPQDVFKGLDAGADNFLVKPYEEAHLISRISYLLANKRIRRSEQSEAGVEIELAGKRHVITAERQQILDLLISTYAQAVVLYDRLDVRQKELACSYDTLNALYDIAGGLNRCRTEAEVTSFAVERGVHIPGVRDGWLNLRQGNGFAVVGRDNRPGAINCVATDGADCTCQRLLESGELSSAFNVEHCERLAGAGPAGGASSHVSIPLKVDGTAAGVLNLIGSGPKGAVSEEERRTFTSIGIQISDAMERARLHEALERKVQERTQALQAEVAEHRQAEQEARTASDRLFDAIESIRAGFALYDANDSLLICNSRIRDMHPAIAHLIVPGASFEELVRAGLGCGDGQPPQPDDTQVKASLVRHRSADGASIVMRIVDDLLDVAKITAGGLNLDLQQTALASILEQTLESRRLGPGVSNVRLEMSDQAKGVRVMADPFRIQQAIDNLLSNAMKFSAADSPIDLTAECRDDVVRVSVKDRGVGIPKAFQGDVFGAFTQADSSSTRQRGGAGLGLRLAKTIVEAHHGKIGFSSTEGKGTIFYFDLPLEGEAISSSQP